MVGCIHTPKLIVNFWYGLHFDCTSKLKSDSYLFFYTESNHICTKFTDTLKNSGLKIEKKNLPLKISHQWGCSLWKNKWMDFHPWELSHEGFCPTLRAVFPPPLFSSRAMECFTSKRMHLKACLRDKIITTPPQYLGEVSSVGWGLLKWVENIKIPLKGCIVT